MFGYARVSSRDQNIDRQLKPLLDLGINERDIFVDKMSGKNFDRPKYQALKEHLRAGDILYVQSIDRFGRNKEQILNEWKDITKSIQAHIIVLDMPLLDTTKYQDLSGLESLITDIFLQILSFFAEEERIKIKDRQREGINIARSKGVVFGRPRFPLPDGFDLIAQKVLDGEMGATAAFRKLNMKKVTFYKRLKEYKNNRTNQFK